MADLKTEQGITAELQKQKALLRDIDSRTKAGLNLKEKIIALEEKLVKVQNTISQSEKDLTKEITKRIAKVRELSTQNNAAAVLRTVAIKAQNSSLNLIKSQVSAGQQLKGNLKEQQDVVLALGSGMNDIAGIQNMQIQSSDRMNKLSKADEKLHENIQRAMDDGNISLATKLQMKSSEIQKQQKIESSIQGNLATELKLLQAEKEKAAQLGFIDKLTGGLASKAKEFADSLKGASVKQKSFLVATALLGSIIAIANKFGASIDKIGETFGSLSVMGEPFKKDLLDASVQATQLGGGLEDVSAITNTLASNFGMSVNEAAKLSGKVFDTSKALGISGDEAANLFCTLMQTANLSAEQAESLAEGAFQLARQGGVAPAAVLKDIAGSTEEIAGFTKDGGNNIADAAVQARQLGLSLSTTAGIARSLLDFESSIAGEIEASLMIGRQLNFQKARQLALDGDISGMMENILDQLGGEAEFNKLSVLERDSLAKSLGRSTAELAKLVKGSEKLTLSGAMASSSFGDLLGQDGISNISSLIGKFKSLGATLVNGLGKPLETALGSFNTFLANKENMDGLIESVKSLASFFTFVAKNIDVAIGSFLGLKVGVMAFTIAQKAMQAASIASAGASAIAGGAAAGAAAGPAAPILIPLLIAGALAAVTAAVSSYAIPSFDNLNPMSGAIVKGGTQNKAIAQIQGGEGVFNVGGLQQQIGGSGNQSKMENALEQLVSLQTQNNRNQENQNFTIGRGKLKFGLEGGLGGRDL